MKEIDWEYISIITTEMRDVCVANESPRTILSDIENMVLGKVCNELNVIPKKQVEDFLDKVGDAIVGNQFSVEEWKEMLKDDLGIEK